MEYSAALYLMDIADATEMFKSQVLEYNSSMLEGAGLSTEAMMDRVALALRFKRSGKFLRAAMEEWDMQRIHRELY